VLHSLCAEAKTRKDTALTTHVPKLKKGMEYFVLEAVAFFRELDPGIGVELGELKHRDLRGNVLVSSQMFPSQLPGDEEEEEDEEEEDEEEEEAEEAEGEGEEMDDGAED